MLERYQAATQLSLYDGIYEEYKCTRSAHLLKGINSPFTHCPLGPAANLTSEDPKGTLLRPHMSGLHQDRKFSLFMLLFNLSLWSEVTVLLLVCYCLAR